MATKTQPLSARNYMIVMAVLSLLIVIAAFVFGNILVGQVIQQGKVQAAKNKAVTQLDKDLVVAPSLIDNYAKLSADKQLIAHSMPSNGDFAALVSAFDNMAQESGVSFKGINPSQEAVSAAPTGSGLKSTGVSASFTGTYDGLKNLLTNIERSARPIRVTNVSINGTGNNLAIQVSAVAYYADEAMLPFSTETLK